jgi:hypothetical protein
MLILLQINYSISLTILIKKFLKNGSTAPEFQNIGKISTIKIQQFRSNRLFIVFLRFYINRPYRYIVWQFKKDTLIFTLE